MEKIIIYILLWLNIVSFIIGYLLGFIRHSSSNNISFFAKNRSSKNQTNIQRSGIEIDDKKVVLNIDTRDLEKKYEELGEKTISETNITNSVNKLKNLKR